MCRMTNCSCIHILRDFIIVLLSTVCCVFYCVYCCCFGVINDNNNNNNSKDFLLGDLKCDFSRMLSGIIIALYHNAKPK